MNFNYTEYITPSNLSLLGIRDLRRLAFAVGVYGYTLYSKNDLIVHIVDVVYGREAPKMEISRGRPSSITKNKLEIITSIVEKINQLRAEQINFDISYVASQSEEYDTGYNSLKLFEDTIDVEGYVDNSSTVWQLRAIKHNAWTTQCYISKAVLEKYGLLPGMKICGEAKLHISGNYFLTEVKSDVKKFDNFDSLEIRKPVSQLILGKGPFENIDSLCPIGLGSRVLICGNSKTINEWKSEFLLSLKSKNMILASSYTSPEDLAEYNSKFDNVFACCFSDNDENQCNAIGLAFNRAKRVAEENGEAVVAITSLPATIKAFDSNAVFSAASNTSPNEQGLYRLRQNCMSAHNTKSNKSITLIAFAEYDNPIQQALVEQISEVFTTRIVCKSLTSNDSNFPLDTDKSFSSFSINN